MRVRRGAILVLFLVGATGCVSLKRTPGARFFVLRSLVEPPPAPTVQPTGGIVGVLPVRLPGHLERPQVVTWRAPSELGVDEFVRWAEPLDAGITRTLRENLARLLPEYRLIERPWPGNTKTLCLVFVELSVFGLQAAGEVRLDGRWALLPDEAGGPFVIRSVSLREPLPMGGTDPAAGVDAMSGLVADLSRRIAEGIRRTVPAEDAAPSPRRGSRTEAPRLDARGARERHGRLG